MIDPATLPQWKRTDRALAHRATKCVVVWNSLAQGTYSPGKNAAKRERRENARRLRAQKVALKAGLARLWKESRA